MNYPRMMRRTAGMPGLTTTLRNSVPVHNSPVQMFKPSVNSIELANPTVQGWHNSVRFGFVPVSQKS